MHKEYAELMAERAASCVGTPASADLSLLAIAHTLMALIAPSTLSVTGEAPDPDQSGPLYDRCGDETPPGSGALSAWQQVLKNHQEVLDRVEREMFGR